MVTTYGITKEDYTKMLESQNGRCAICGGINPNHHSKKMQVDHDHNTGKIRGLLCVRCNAGLGCFNDDFDLMLKAVEYLVGRC